MPTKAHRLNNLPQYIFVTIAQRIQELTAKGADVIRLDIGSPDMPPPPQVLEEMVFSVQQTDQHGYAGYRGIASFRKAVAEYYLRQFGVSLDSETEVLPLIGSKEGIVNLCFAFLDKGDLALVPSIGYPSYVMAPKLAGADVSWVPMKKENNYLLDLSGITAIDAEKSKLLWVNYPNNPTGAVADLDFYSQLVSYCQEHDILLASDNPYAHIMYDGLAPVSPLQINGAKACTIEFMSFSKTYNMAGWRLGAAVGNAEALRNLLHMKSNMDSGHFKATYNAGITALRETPQSWIDTRNQCYQDRRDRIMAALPLMGLKASTPKGAMYVWAETESGNSEDYVSGALNEAHVSLAPGDAYGPDGKGFVRFSVGLEDEKIDLALDRLKKWYANQH